MTSANPESRGMFDIGREGGSMDGWLPSGEHTKSNVKSSFLMGKPTINGHFPLLC